MPEERIKVIVRRTPTYIAKFVSLSVKPTSFAYEQEFTINYTIRNEGTGILDAFDVGAATIDNRPLRKVGDGSTQYIKLNPGETKSGSFVRKLMHDYPTADLSSGSHSLEVLLFVTPEGADEAIDVPTDERKLPVTLIAPPECPAGKRTLDGFDTVERIHDYILPGELGAKADRYCYLSGEDSYGFEGRMEGKAFPLIEDGVTAKYGRCMAEDEYMSVLFDVERQLLKECFGKGLARLKVKCNERTAHFDSGRKLLEHYAGADGKITYDEWHRATYDNDPDRATITFDECDFVTAAYAVFDGDINAFCRAAPPKPVRVTATSPIPLYFSAGGDAPTRIPCTQSAGILGEASELLTGMTEEDILEHYHVDFTEEKVYKTVRKGYEITATWNLGKGTIHFDVKAVPSEVCRVTISTPEYAINGTVTPFTEPIDAIRTREGGYEATWEITNTLFRGNVIPGCEKATLVFFRMPPEHWVLDEVKSSPCGDNFEYTGTATGITLTIWPPECILKLETDKKSYSIGESIVISGKHYDDEGPIVSTLGLSAYLNGALADLWDPHTGRALSPGITQPRGDSKGEFRYVFTPEKTGTWEFFAWNDCESTRVRVTVTGVAPGPVTFTISDIEITPSEGNYIYVGKPIKVYVVVDNEGTVAGGGIAEVFVDGVKVKTASIPRIPAKDSDGFPIEILASETAGAHTVKVTVAPTGEAVTATREITYIASPLGIRPITITAVELRWINSAYRAAFRVSNLVPATRYRVVIYGGRGKEWGREMPTGVTSVRISADIPKADLDRLGYKLTCGVYNLDTGTWVKDEDWVVPPYTVKGNVDISRSTIPTTIYLEESAVFDMMVENTGDREKECAVVLTFKNVDTGEEFKFTPENTIRVPARGKGGNRVSVIMPSGSVPAEKETQSFDLIYKLEIW